MLVVGGMSSGIGRVLVRVEATLGFGKDWAVGSAVPLGFIAVTETVLFTSGCGAVEAVLLLQAVNPLTTHRPTIHNRKFINLNSSHKSADLKHNNPDIK
jgi:hypothetical protein